MTIAEQTRLEKDWKIYCKNAKIDDSKEPFASYSDEKKKEFLEQMKIIAVKTNKGFEKFLGTSYDTLAVMSKRLHITLPHWAVQKLDAVKEKYGFSRSKILESLIAKYLEKEFGDISN